MKLTGTVQRLRIYTGEQCKLEGKPLFERIVEQARQQGLAGATVLKGSMGYGANSRIKTSKIFMLSEDLPMVIEIVDKKERIQSFIPWLDSIMPGGMVTIEDVDAILYRPTSSSDN